MAGRPRIEIDAKKFELYCSIMCTQEEIAFLFQCSVDTIDRWCKRTFKKNFAEIYKKYAEDGKMSLRRAMFRNAIKNNNTTMQIWLSKQHLGMSDKKELLNEDGKSFKLSYSLDEDK